MSFYVVFVLGQYYHFVNIANTNVTADETTSFNDQNKYLQIEAKTFADT